MHVSNLCSPVTTWSFGKKERKKLPVGSTLHYVTHILCWLFKKQLLFKFTHLSFFYSYFLSIIILWMTWFFYRLKLFFSDLRSDPWSDPWSNLWFNPDFVDATAVQRFVVLNLKRLDIESQEKINARNQKTRLKLQDDIYYDFQIYIPDLSKCP